ncbi:ankyrin repeat domain-containing protein SOWAHC-like [Clarias gariepinus]|uniref:ankyrin repeat domain-containing protein SOWAHC-like n=1 Tax=Clarias gariepinus TaxID=13013 RepID=UPI00234CAA9C|nr:ankyrin repeat domain-containing protein SOWAHC-like [Clarias gariepinus]
MATECTQEAVLCFLTERGGRVKNTDLIDHFRSVVSCDPERRAAVKGEIKSYVDRVAVVRVENGEKYVCLRKRFRGSVKRQEEEEKDGLDNSSSAAAAVVLETSLSAEVTHGNRRDACLAPVIPDASQRHALDVPSENKDAKQEIPPVSGGASAGERTPWDISQTNPDVKPEDKTRMGNAGAGNRSRSNTTTNKDDAQTTGECTPVSEPSPLPKAVLNRQDLPTTHADSPTESRSERENGRSGGSPGLCRDLREGGTHEGRSESHTPRGRRKSFRGSTVIGSPQVRRSVVHRHSRHSAKSDGESTATAQGEDESATATLDPVEHAWMMCACDGEWDSLRRMLDTDPGLVSKRDFVTGFTCLHWAAKLGKHELLAHIVNFARQRGVALDVNARSSAGYTPLHLAAAHNHVEVIKMLVGACDADVEARDYSGKKASQYLRDDVARDVLDIAGADAERTRDPVAELAGGDEAARWKLPRVLHANLRLLNRSASEDDDRDSDAIKPLRRKSSFNKLKPRINKARAGITAPVIVHSTSHFDRLEGATSGQTSGPFRSRPKSNLFG